MDRAELMPGIEKLSRWSRVALAARCALRVLPLVADAPGELKKHVEDATSFAALAAQFANATQARRRLRSRLFAGWHRDPDFAGHPVATASFVAMAAGEAADHAGAAATAETTDLTVDAGGRTISLPPMDGSSHDIAAVNATADAMTGAMAAVGTWPIIRDLDHLLYITRISPRPGAGVPQSIFGPMWPDGEPDGWPGANSGEAAKTGAPVAGILVALDIDRSHDQAKAIEGITKIYEGLDKLHRAQGGAGLRVRRGSIREGCYAPEVVPNG